MSSTLHPEVLWAQRSSETEDAQNVLFVTINLPDIQKDSLKFDLQPTKVSFAAKAGDAAKGIQEKDYAFDLDFFAEIDPEASSHKLTTRSLVLNLRKKEKQAEYWPRLTKEKVRSQFIKTDFSKWVDEDEQEGEAAPAEDEDFMGGMPGGMGGMPGMGGMGGMPGMGGMGGMPGMGGMGGMPGMEGMGGMDMEKLMAQMGQMGAGGAGPSGSGADDDDDDDSDDDGPPPLEEAEPAK
ncbi:HSP20-like chaperone [Schizophyllum amplum]|uniref:HSP20-like chaperone n=1 Tax=Schizophyllum amplum TaxID=97359 RepID=A0A550CLF2_9AGAR|nr:HSP20-like chaperone [Auriculariopsis ampla]